MTMQRVANRRQPTKPGMSMEDCVTEILELLPKNTRTITLETVFANCSHPTYLLQSGHRPKHRLDFTTSRIESADVLGFVPLNLLLAHRIKQRINSSQ